jgi:hypothetical protein
LSHSNPATLSGANPKINKITPKSAENPFVEIISAKLRLSYQQLCRGALHKNRGRLKTVVILGRPLPGFEGLLNSADDKVEGDAAEAHILVIESGVSPQKQCHGYVERGLLLRPIGMVPGQYR